VSTYNRILFPGVPVVTPPKEENALLAQERVNWLQSAGTKVLFKGLSDQINELRKQATALAITYPTHQNHLQIIQLLQHADNLQQTIDRYGRYK
jgi:hypothetical protein